MENHSSSTSTQSSASSSPARPSASTTASPQSSTISASRRSTSAPLQPPEVLTKAAEKVFAMCAPGGQSKTDSMARSNGSEKPSRAAMLDSTSSGNRSTSPERMPSSI